MAHHLARVVADSGLVFAGLVPWNMLALLCAHILGVNVLACIRYAVFLWSLPVITVIWSFLTQQIHPDCAPQWPQPVRERS